MQNLPQYTTYRSLLEQRQWQGFSETEVIDILRQVLSQLTKLHDLKQAHGAISLDTVAYDSNRMYIVLLSGQGNNYPIYLAPEVAISREATPAGDIYALGVFTIALLTGLPPEKLKTPKNEWNWEEYCDVSSRFSQILNITLFDSLDFRYVNAGQMLKSIQSILITNDSDSQSEVENVIAAPAIASTLPVEAIPNQSLLLNNSLPIDLSKPLPLPPSTLSGFDSISPDEEKLDFSSKNRQEISELKAELPDSPTYRRTKISTNPNKDLAKSNVTANSSNRVLPILLWGFGIVAIGIVASYFYNQTGNRGSSIENSIANTSVTSPTDQTVTTESEAARIDRLKKTEEQFNKLIVSAKTKYESTGNLNEAKTILQEVPVNSPLRSKADLLLRQWQEDLKKNNDLIAKAELAIANGSGQQAINIVKGMSATPYWQQRSKKILENAKQQLNRRIETPAPNIASPPDYIPPANPEPPATYPEIPETPSYSAPSYSAPPQEPQPKEAPPPPRAAN